MVGVPSSGPSFSSPDQHNFEDLKENFQNEDISKGNQSPPGGADISSDLENVVAEGEESEEEILRQLQDTNAAKDAVKVKQMVVSKTAEDEVSSLNANVQTKEAEKTQGAVEFVFSRHTKQEASEEQLQGFHDEDQAAETEKAKINASQSEKAAETAELNSQATALVKELADEIQFEATPQVSDAKSLDEEEAMPIARAPDGKFDICEKGKTPEGFFSFKTGRFRAADPNSQIGKFLEDPSIPVAEKRKFLASVRVRDRSGQEFKVRKWSNAVPADQVAFLAARCYEREAVRIANAKLEADKKHVDESSSNTSEKTDSSKESSKTLLRHSFDAHSQKLISNRQKAELACARFLNQQFANLEHRKMEKMAHTFFEKQRQEKSRRQDELEKNEQQEVSHTTTKKTPFGEEHVVVKSHTYDNRVFKLSTNSINHQKRTEKIDQEKHEFTFFPNDLTLLGFLKYSNTAHKHEPHEFSVMHLQKAA